MTAITNGTEKFGLISKHTKLTLKDLQANAKRVWNLPASNIIPYLEPDIKN